MLLAVCATTLTKRIRSLMSPVLSLRYAYTPSMPLTRQSALAMLCVCCLHARPVHLIAAWCQSACLCIFHAQLPKKVTAKVMDISGVDVQNTQQKVREAVQEQQNTVRSILQLAPVPQDEPECRYCLASYTVACVWSGIVLSYA